MIWRPALVYLLSCINSKIRHWCRWQRTEIHPIWTQSSAAITIIPTYPTITCPMKMTWTFGSVCTISPFTLLNYSKSLRKTLTLLWDIFTEFLNQLWFWFPSCVRTHAIKMSQIFNGIIFNARNCNLLRSFINCAYWNWKLAIVNGISTQNLMHLCAKNLDRAIPAWLNWSNEQPSPWSTQIPRLTFRCRCPRMSFPLADCMFETRSHCRRFEMIDSESFCSNLK